MSRTERAGDAGGYEPLAQVVAKYLREQILDGHVPPGTPLRQEAVARDLGTSRIPVREALHQLEGEGLVTIRPHSGARVAVLDFNECMELYKIRERVEPLAFAESVASVTTEQVDRVTELLDRVGGLTDDYTAWIEADREFHIACYAGARLPHLTRLVNEFWNTTQQYRRILVRRFDRQDYELFQCDHRLMVEALESRNARGGEELTRLHIERARLRISLLRDEFDH